jgi:DNA adenine methylase
MKSPFKYSGGKSREAKFLTSLVNVNSTQRIVEPFAGSAAFAFFLEKPALISDVRKDVITTLEVIQDNKLYPLLQEKLDSLRRETDIKLLEKEFYVQRDQFWKSENKLEIAYRFIVIRQLVFSGIDRINIKTGKENAPFGWYPHFKCHLSDAHHKLLQNWEIKLQSFEKTLNETHQNDLVFFDPPYLERNSVYGGEVETSLELHQNLLSSIRKLDCNWLIVHCDSPLYRNFGNEFKMYEKQFSYYQNFKGRDNSKSKTSHLYISNE